MAEYAVSDAPDLTAEDGWEDPDESRGGEGDGMGGGAGSSYMWWD